MDSESEKQKEENKEDWFEKLSSDQQQSIFRSLKQADKGETIPHIEAICRLGCKFHLIKHINTLQLQQPLNLIVKKMYF